jgi:hypothetical protein
MGGETASTTRLTSSEALGDDDDDDDDAPLDLWSASIAEQMV